MISIQDIRFSLKRRCVLDDICFDAAPGELVVILGANGSGKSTLLKVIRGEIKPDSGCTTIGGKPLTGWKNHELSQCMAFLQQHTQLSLPYTVRDVVMMGRYPHFQSRPGIVDSNIVDAVMHKTGVHWMKDKSYLQLSGGEQQRVHIARAFAQIWYCERQEVRYLLMDEPGNNLDICHQHNVLKMARDFTREGNCVVAVLHDLNMALQYADKIILLNKGAVISNGKPALALNNKNLTHAYGFPMNMCYHQNYEHPIVLPAN